MTRTPAPRLTPRLLALGLLLLGLGQASARPIPDYAPLAALVTHHQLDDLAPDLIRALDRHLGKRHIRERYDPGAANLNYTEAADPDSADTDTTLVWMRDYQLLYSRAADGSLQPWRYLSINANRSSYRPDPRSAELPLVHENGNLVVVGDRIFVGERLIEENDGHLAEEPDLRGRPYKARSRAEVLLLLADALGVSPKRITVFKPLPSEGTGHVDLFLMPLDDKTVLIPKISASDIRAFQELHQVALAREAQRHLDAAAERVAALGLKVVRAPMLPPMLWTAVDAEPGEDAELDAVYYSPANTLLANLGKGRKLAFLPMLAEHAVPPELNKGLARKYTRATARLLRQHGWRPIVVDATDLGRWLGLFRCVTAAIPAP